ncbi:hypothetical protein SLA2020_400530 [Shorea laevis]
MSIHQYILDFLLSLQQRVLETSPPGSPSPHSSGYVSDDGSPRRAGQADMSVFRNAIEDCLHYEPKPVQKAGRLKGPRPPMMLRLRNSRAC